MMNISPLMLAQLALERPDLLASQMASAGRQPPALNIQTASGTPGTEARAEAQFQSAMPQAPTQPGIAPLTQQLMTPQPAAVPAGPRGTPGQQQDASNMAAAQAAGNTAPGVPAAPAAPAAPDPLAAALAGVAPSLAGGGQQGRVPLAPAPFIPSALNPQTLEILKAALAQPTTGVPSLGALIGGGR